VADQDSRGVEDLGFGIERLDWSFGTPAEENANRNAALDAIQ
jgi:hypothetical protein